MSPIFKALLKNKLSKFNLLMGVLKHENLNFEFFLVVILGVECNTQDKNNLLNNLV